MIPLFAQVPISNLDEFVDAADVTTWDFVWGATTIIAGVIIARIARGWVRGYAVRANLPGNTVDMLGVITSWSVIAIATVIALTFVGLNLTPLWILILVVAAMFVVGGRVLVEAFGAGVVLQARSPFEPGDLVAVDDQRGVVREINSRTVVIDTIDGRRVFIPNRTVLDGIIVNLTHRKLRMSSLDLDVTYGTDLDHACAVAAGSLENAEAVLQRPSPIAEVRSFESSSVRIRLRFWHESDLISEWKAVDEAARLVYAAYNDGGIEFAFPQRTLWWGGSPPDDGDVLTPDT